MKVLYCLSLVLAVQACTGAERADTATVADPNPLRVIATASVQPGSEDVFRNALPAVVKATRAEPGNFRYRDLESLSLPKTFVVVETWKDQVAMTEVFSGPTLPLIKRSIPDLTSSFEEFAGGLKRRAEVTCKVPT